MTDLAAELDRLDPAREWEPWEPGILTPFPLRERMTLFWHNHFATSIAKVKLPALMRDQNLLLRRHALGKFGPLVQAVSKDPAMLVWLDSNSNVRGKPNENYARELMELFCLGTGHYTETDVREAARAFTGWHTNVSPDGAVNPSVKPAFVFQRSLHDDGEKTFLGRTGNWDGGDVVRIVLNQPACARFLVRKLYKEFVSEAAAPPDNLVEPLADRLRKSDYDVGDVLKVMLRSRHFYSAFAHRQRVKGPVEYVVGLLRSLEAKMPGEAVGLSLPAATQELGQTLFAPPSVKEWDGGQAWLNTATVLARHNMAWRLLQGSSGPHAVKLNPAALVHRYAPGDDPAKQTAFLFDLLVQPAAGEIDDRAKAKLTAFLAEGNPQGTAFDRRAREAAHAVASMPLFQLA
jgi:uncharacterized protein (DUF1800 family)